MFLALRLLLYEMGRGRGGQIFDIAESLSVINKTFLFVVAVVIR